MEKLFVRPTAFALCLKNSAPIEWKVPTDGRSSISALISFKMLFILSNISPAAFFVNVTARIFSGLTFFSLMRYAILLVITRVFPDPAPAKTRRGPSVH